MNEPSQPSSRQSVRFSTLKIALKPSSEEILALAEREATPEFVSQFDPICHGPVFAVFALAVIGIASIPGIVMRVLTLAGPSQRAKPR
jgi:hypothetical protein